MRGVHKKRMNKTITRILKVDHAGEHGAIRIYRAQIFMARLLLPELLPFLQETLSHELVHHQRFQNALKEYNGRPCRMLWLWGVGGCMLGLASVALGTKGVMICTAAVERTVHLHMREQIRYLAIHAPELSEMVGTILKDELQHLAYAESRIDGNSLIARSFDRIIALVTETLIFLSTSGDSLRLKRELV